MKDIENIEDWYRNELDNFNVEPDKGTWDALSEDLDADAPLTNENISEWYKKEITKLEERPDYTVWEKLSTKLDTASVWDKLVISLNRYDQFIWWRNLAFRGTAVFLLLFGSYLAYDNYSNNESVIKEKNTNSLTEKSNTNSELKNSTISNSNNSKSTSKINENVMADVSANKTSSNNLNKTSLTTQESIKQTTNKARKNIDNKGNKNSGDVLYASIHENITGVNPRQVTNLNNLKSGDEPTLFKEIDRHGLSERDISHLYSSSDFLVKKDNNKIVFNSKRFSSYFIFGLYARRIYVGINTGFKKQGIITSLKKDSPLAAYNRTDFLDFGTSFGGTVGFIVSDNFNIEANVNINSTGGYKRAYSSEGLSYKEELNLNYTSVSILGKKMNNKSTFDNKVYSTNLIGGIYASYLTTATSDINGVSHNLDEFKNTDLGIVLGIEQDRYITKSLVITPGLRYNQGLLNIAGENSMFNSGRNFSFEFNLGVKYIFLKKGK